MTKIITNSPITSKILTNTKINPDPPTTNKNPSISSEPNSEKQAETKSSSKSSKRNISSGIRASRKRKINKNKPRFKKDEVHSTFPKKKHILHGKLNNS